MSCCLKLLIVSLRLRYFPLVFVDHLWFFEEIALPILKIEVSLFFLCICESFYLLRISILICYKHFPFYLHFIILKMLVQGDPR